MINFFHQSMAMIPIPGEHKISSRSETRKLTIKARQPFIIHPRFEENARLGYLLYDFVLIKLERINFDHYPHIRPICLPSSRSRDNDGQGGVVVGWGFTTIIEYLDTGFGFVMGIGKSPSLCRS